MDIQGEPGYSVRTHILNYHWQRMWAPIRFTIYLSDNGIDFTPVAEKNRFNSNGINTIRSVFSPRKTSHLKIVAINKGIIPEGSYGAGSKALLLLDEITVD
jgi:hexosaminidase